MPGYQQKRRDSKTRSRRNGRKFWLLTPLFLSAVVAMADCDALHFYEVRRNGPPGARLNAPGAVLSVKLLTVRSWSPRG